MRILQRQQERQRDQGTYTLDLFQQRHLRVTLLGETLDALVVLGDALADRSLVPQSTSITWERSIPSEAGLLPRKHLAQAMRGWRVTECPRLSRRLTKYRFKPSAWSRSK
jgi:hypothetical protein